MLSVMLSKETKKCSKRFGNRYGKPVFPKLNMEPLRTPDDGNAFPYGSSSPNVEDSLVLKHVVGEDFWVFSRC